MRSFLERVCIVGQVVACLILGIGAIIFSLMNLRERWSDDAPLLWLIGICGVIVTTAAPALLVKYGLAEPTRPP
ncbi:MAG: hypothetical protein AAGI12_16025 [Pseudomonadota bacterium]